MKPTDLSLRRSAKLFKKERDSTLEISSSLVMLETKKTTWERTERPRFGSMRRGKMCETTEEMER